MWLACVLLAPVLVNRLAPAFMDADAVIPALMSTQHLTLFYWGQDRLAGVLPLLFSPVASPQWNLLLQLCANAAAYFLMLEGVGEVASLLLPSPPSPLRRPLLFSLLVALPLLLLRPFALYQFAAGPQPYALSFVLLIWAALLWRRQSSLRAAPMLCALLLATSLGLNPATLLLVAALWAFQARLGHERAWRGFLLLAVALFAVWTFLSRTYPLHSPSSYLQFSPATVPAALQQSIADLRNNAIRPRYFVALLIAVSLWVHQRGVAILPPDLRRAMLALLGFSVCWWLFFLSNRWVQDNGCAFRYFMPLIFAPVIVFAVALTACVEDLARRRLPAALIGACLTVFALFAVRPWTPVMAYDAFTAVAAPLHVAKERHIRYFAGDYWQAWPVVFALHAENLPAMGAFSRGSAMRETIIAALRADLGRGETPLAMCIHRPLPTCQDHLLELSRMHWELADLPPEADSLFLRPSLAP